MKLDLLMDVGNYNGTMGLTIANNGKKIYNCPIDSLTAGLVNINLSDIDPGILEISSSGKGPYDTLIDQNHNVVKDKYIEIKLLSIDFLTFEKFHLHHSSVLFDPYFSKNETKKITIPKSENLLQWYLTILENHELNNFDFVV